MLALILSVGTNTAYRHAGVYHLPGLSSDMPMKATGDGELAIIDRFERGVGWIAHPEETMRRASHAVESDSGLWVFDPIDVDGLDELLAEFAEPAGVAVLLDRHKRDSAAIANRHDVPVYVPEWMDGVASEIDAPTKRFSDRLANFDVWRLIDNPFWQEATLFDGETLVVPEALGTASYFLSPGEALGVHPMLRALPPKQLGEYDPDRLLVGHGSGINENVGQTVRKALTNSRRSAPSLYLKTIGNALGVR